MIPQVAASTDTEYARAPVDIEGDGYQLLGGEIAAVVALHLAQARFCIGGGTRALVTGVYIRLSSNVRSR